MCRAHFGADAWPADSRTRTDKWNCAPSSVGPHPVGDSLSSTRTGTASLAAFQTYNGPFRHPQTSKRQVRDALEARSGVVARASSVVKRRLVPIGGLACGGVHCSRLNRSLRRVHTSCALDVLLVERGGPSRRGAKRYPMAAYTSVRRLDTIDLSKAVNHRESAFLAPGRHDRSTIRLEVYFFLATRASRMAGR